MLFIIAFKHRFRMCYWKGPRKPVAGIQIEWNTSASGLCWRCLFIWTKHKYHKEKHKSFIRCRYGLEVNAEKTMYRWMVMSCYQTTGQNYCIKAANKSVENVAEFKHLGMTVTNQNYIHAELKSRLDPGILATVQLRIFHLLGCFFGMWRLK
jgi:hypothetical protein